MHWLSSATVTDLNHSKCKRFSVLKFLNIWVFHPASSEGLIYFWYCIVCLRVRRETQRGILQIKVRRLWLFSWAGLQYGADCSRRPNMCRLDTMCEKGSRRSRCSEYFSASSFCFHVHCWLVCGNNSNVNGAQLSFAILAHTSASEECVSLRRMY